MKKDDGMMIIDIEIVEVSRDYEVGFIDLFITN